MITPFSLPTKHP